MIYDIFVICNLIYSHTKSQNVNFSSQIHHLVAFREAVKKTTLLASLLSDALGVTAV